METDRKESLIAYADYLRRYLSVNTPPDWKKSMFGDFPGSTVMYHKYFTFVLEQTPDSRKAKLIEQRFKLQKITTLEKKIEVIDGKPRSIERFFLDETVPHEQNLNFIAGVFDAPIQTLEQFIASQQTQISRDILPVENTSRFSPKKQRSPKRNQIIFTVTGVIFLSVLAILFGNQLFRHLNASPENPQMQSVENRFFLTDLGSKLYENRYDKIEISDKSMIDTVLFHTINIFNDRCLTKAGHWTFETDPKGEDMNSVFGQPFNEDIVTMYPQLNDVKTIANEQMDIHFNFENKFDFPIEFSSLKLVVTNTYDAKAEKASYNLYRARAEEQYYDVQLGQQNMYGFTVSKANITPGQALFCRLRVSGQPEAQNIIYKFSIIADFTDNAGKHYRTVSDKYFLIGFCK